MGYYLASICRIRVNGACYYLSCFHYEPIWTINLALYCSDNIFSLPSALPYAMGGSKSRIALLPGIPFAGWAHQ
jgi:hypothetical protein